MAQLTHTLYGSLNTHSPTLSHELICHTYFSHHLLSLYHYDTHYLCTPVVYCFSHRPMTHPPPSLAWLLAFFCLFGVVWLKRMSMKQEHPYAFHMCWTQGGYGTSSRRQILQIQQLLTALLLFIKQISFNK